MKSADLITVFAFIGIALAETDFLPAISMKDKTACMELQCPIDMECRMQTPFCFPGEVCLQPKPECKETTRNKRIAFSTGVAALVLGKIISEEVVTYVKHGFERSSTTADFSEITGTLAPNFAEVRGSYQTMDKELQRIIAIIAREIENLPENKQIEWKDLVNQFSNCPFVSTMPGSYVTRNKELNLGSRVHIFKIDGSPDPQVVSRVKDWYRNELVQDADVLLSAMIRDKELTKVANIVAETGARVISMATAIHRDVEKTKNVIDINAIRFPDSSRPYLMLYRISLVAKAKCTRVLFVQKDYNYIKGTFQSIKFEPNKSVIRDLSPELKSKIDAYGNSLFG